MLLSLITERMLALGTWLIDLTTVFTTAAAVTDDGPENRTQLISATIVAAAISLLLMAASAGLRLVARRWLARTPSGHDQLLSSRAWGPFLPLITAWAWLVAIGVALSPLLTRVGPVGAGIAAWLLLAVGLWLATRTALAVCERFAAQASQRALASASPWDDLLVAIARQVVKTLILVGALYAAAACLVFSPAVQAAVDALFGLTFIGVLAWLGVALVGLGENFIKQRFRIDVPDNLQARRIYTQVVVLRRIAYLVIGLLALALALMQFDGIRRIGTSILASAGLAGVILGFAAQRTLANLLAGIQIALTQPLRMDDVVVMEGEWGRIEEVTLTYVVVACWDQRRLIVPLSRIIEQPFQNWTRTGSQLLGTVTMRCDFRVPVEELRTIAKATVAADPRWDKRSFAVQITEWGERTVEVRVLLSAGDAGALFDLRCAVRERLLTWLQAEHAYALPVTRFAMSGLAGVSDLPTLAEISAHYPAPAALVKKPAEPGAAAAAP